MKMAVLPILLALAPLPGIAADGFHLQVVFRDEGKEQELKSWTIEELTRSKQVTSHEMDPSTSKVVRWKGPLLAPLIETALNQISLEKRAQVDLVVLKGQDNAQAVIPRSFVVKYPLVLALSMEQRDLGSRGPVFSLAPWTSRGKAIEKEELPVETYFVPGLKTVELTNSHEKYGYVYLRKRSDPLALRGEKRFVQSCLACHATGRGPALSDVSSESRARALASAGHPNIKGAPKLDEKERRSLQTYLDAIRAEGAPPAPGTAAAPPPQASAKN